MSSPVVIGEALDEPTDVDAVEAIDRACFAQNTVSVAAELDRPWAKLWVARTTALAPPVGYLLAWHVADELHVLSVATLPAEQRRGVGRALLAHAIAFAATRRVRLVLLEVRCSNVRAIELYQTLGFRVVGTRPRYYADNFEDATEMSLLLDPQTGVVLVPSDDSVRSTAETT
jgi:ribosomal-protein-alanine N-acetyltransferase